MAVATHHRLSRDQVVWSFGPDLEPVLEVQPGDVVTFETNHLHGPGARVYMPVRQPGGMFATGDMHASMGDGELCFTGVEIAGTATIRFDLVKRRQSAWPVTELADRWVVHGTSGEDFADALDRAAEEAQRLLVEQWGFTAEEPFVFLSVACDARICQACRCPLAHRSAPRSVEEPPPLRDVGRGHLVACHLVGPGGEAPSLADARLGVA
jgi:acetamidase/formamidase